MKRLAAVALLAACGGGKAAPPPDAALPEVLADPKGPAADRAPCATASVLDATPVCRVDGSRDLDGDGAIDCWRASGALSVWIWPSCAGAPVELALTPAPVMAIELPDRFREPAWANGVAQLFGPVPERTWRDGPPVAGAPTAHVAGTMLTIADPGIDTPGLDPELVKAATCDAWEVWTGPHEAVIVDRANHLWSRVGPFDTRLGDAACTDDLVILPHPRGVDLVGILSVSPKTGRTDDDVINGYDWRAMFDAGVLRTGHRGVISLRQLGALLAEPVADGPPPACPAGPLLALPPGPPCTRAAQCWSATREGTSDATLAWHFEYDDKCKGKPIEFTVDLNHVVSVVEAYGSVPLIWLGTVLAGDHFGCLPLSKKSKCPVPGPHVQWLYSRLYHFGGRGDGSGLTLPVWQPGTPALPAASATFVRYLPERDNSVLLVHSPDAEPVRGAPLALSSSCARWDVWTSPAAAAVVDRATHQWTWVYFASEVAAFGGWPTPVGAGRCDDKNVTLDLGTQKVVVDPTKGSWVIVPA